MADSMEIPSGSLLLLAIPPPRLVILSAVTILASPVRVIQQVLGGVMAALLALLPQLHDAVPRLVSTSWEQEVFQAKMVT